MELPKELLEQVIKIGTIWRVPNTVWKKFAKANNPKNFHPGLVSKINKDNFTLQLTPGTSKRQGGKCVFNMPSTSNIGKTNYILKMSIPSDVDKVSKYHNGFGGNRILTDAQIWNLQIMRQKCLKYG